VISLLAFVAILENGRLDYSVFSIGFWLPLPEN